jgi:hypothetical protein
MEPRKFANLEEYIGAAEIEFTPDDLREIETAASKIEMQGARYPDTFAKIGWPVILFVIILCFFFLLHNQIIIMPD